MGEISTGSSDIAGALVKLKTVNDTLVENVNAVNEGLQHFKLEGG